MELYKCCRCKEKLSREAFGGITVRGDYCKPCKREYENNKRKDPIVAERRRASNRRAAAKRYQINRTRLVEYLLAHPCIDCGETDPIVLEFDHFRDKKVQVGDILGSWNWNTIMTEIVKCEIRCANCHRRKTHKERGWYTKGGDAK